MVADTTLMNRDLLVEEIQSESPSLEHFFRQQFGFCAQDGHQLVAWCLAEYHAQGRYELGIETIEAYRRQGIATRLADAVVRHAYAQGATEIGWHCWAANTPSVATALKVGFEKVLDYPVWYGHYRPERTNERPASGRHKEVVTRRGTPVSPQRSKLARAKGSRRVSPYSLRGPCRFVILRGHQGNSVVERMRVGSACSATQRLAWASSNSSSVAKWRLARTVFVSGQRCSAGCSSGE